MAKKDLTNIPRHVGIIMDGNRRWATKRLLPAPAGHSAGLKRMVALAERAKELGVRYLTVYALSTENLMRPKDELEKMYELIRKHFCECVEKLLPDDVRVIIETNAAKSPDKADFTFIMALGYGARNEIVRAANIAAESGVRVDEQAFSRLLYTDGVPDPDFIIRTGGELRLSNFLLWQAAYAELYFTDALFPDFTDDKFERAIGDYSARTRRFGKV